jgi:5-methyltetrahydropteroyltriglutamate--homocysteine methyltransferase
VERSTDRILTTHTGSLPRPPDLAAALVQRDHGGVAAAADDFDRRVREAVAAVVRRQVETGIDIVSDGEMGKFGYSTYVKERLSGFDGADEPLALADLADFPDYASRIDLSITTPACTGAVAFRGDAAVAADVDNLRAAVAATPPRQAFIAAASPGLISVFLHNRHYPSDEAYLYALADAMKPEYDAIAEAGFLLQIDAPDLAMGRHLAVPPMDIAAFRDQAARHVAALNHATRDIPADRMRLHACWGNYEAPHHHDVPLAEIADILFSARPTTLVLEGANPRHEHEWAVFAATPLPDDKTLVVGCIDTRSNYIEHPEVVAQRIERYAGTVGRERVVAGTDCGFATFANFLSVDPAIAWRKLGALVEGAAIASGRLW